MKIRFAQQINPSPQTVVQCTGDNLTDVKQLLIDSRWTAENHPAVGLLLIRRPMSFGGSARIHVPKNYWLVLIPREQWLATDSCPVKIVDPMTFQDNYRMIEYGDPEPYRLIGSQPMVTAEPGGILARFLHWWKQ